MSKESEEKFLLQHTQSVFLTSVKVGLSYSKKIRFVCFNVSPLEMVKNAFYIILKALLKSLDFLVAYKKQLDHKHYVNFKTYDAITWLTNNCNSHIAQYLTK